MSTEGSLQALYPFLSGEPQNQGELDASLLRSTLEKAGESRRVNAEFFTGQAPALVAAARALAQVYRSGGRLLTMGNGGSSCDAAHLAVEFAHPVTAGRPALAAVGLVNDVALLSAVGNDVGFEHVFVRALLSLARPGDALAGFSTSGSSKNLLAAFAKARELRLVTFGFSGGDGGAMRSSGLVDHCLVVPSSSIHRVQECHVAAYHVLWDLVHTLLAGDRGSAHRKEAAR
jgi:D-sedoheptulose 7-phosphate isomerase